MARFRLRAFVALQCPVEQALRTRGLLRSYTKVSKDQGSFVGVQKNMLRYIMKHKIIAYFCLVSILFCC